MKLRKPTLLLFTVLSLTIVGCDNEDRNNDTAKYTREISDTANVAAIMHGFDAKDTSVIGAYLEDRSTITINDIDPKDTTYSTRSKVLYNGPKGEKLAVVYGLKAEGKGMAVVQKIGEKPVFLREGSRKDDVITYTDGEFKLEKSGDFVFIDGVQYQEVK